MSNWTLSLPMITGIIAIMTAVITLTVYFTKLFLRNDLLRQKEDHNSEIAEKRSIILALETSNQSLNDALNLVRVGKEKAIILLNELDGLMTQARSLTKATADSILIENPYVRGQLIFLRIHGNAAEKIKRMMTPISGSQAGHVFVSGKISYFDIADNNNTLHFNTTDKESGYKTKNIISIPLEFNGESLAVLQMLNKENGENFDESDFLKIEHLCPEIILRLIQLIKDPTSLKALGIIETTDSIDATILFSDITNFSSSFGNLPNRQVTEIVNEYFDRLCDICIQNGGSIDKYLGDGFLVRFNSPRRINNYVDAAIHSSLMMQQEFDFLKKDWNKIGLPVARISNRIGIATGPVIGGLMGHSQNLSYTVMGNTVNLASNLCEMAHSFNSGVLVCERTIEKVSENIKKSINFTKFDRNHTIGYEIFKTGEIKFSRRKSDN
jgi:class 3 adenylate cyclase